MAYSISLSESNTLFLNLFDACMLHVDITFVLSLFQSLWDNLKRRTIEKADMAKKSGAGGVVLTRVENLVLDAIGKDGAYLNGVGFQAPYPTFSGLNKPTRQEAAASVDSSLNESTIYSNSWNQSYSHEQSFENFGK